MSDKYYWYCPVCKTKEVYVGSLEEARAELEKHEAIAHKSKAVGTFGKEICD